jgi:heme A synthase
MVGAVGGWLSGTEAAVLLVILVLATLGTATLFLIGMLGYRQRRTRTYLLMTVVLGLLVVRSVVGIGTVLGFVPMPVHHLIEHGADLTVSALVLYALFQMGPPTLD